MKILLTDCEKYCPIEEFTHQFPDVDFSIVKHKPLVQMGGQECCGCYR